MLLLLLHVAAQRMSLAEGLEPIMSGLCGHGQAYLSFCAPSGRQDVLIVCNHSGRLLTEAESVLAATP